MWCCPFCYQSYQRTWCLILDDERRETLWNIALTIWIDTLACMKRFVLHVIAVVVDSHYESVEITSKMQPCNRVYYSKVYRRLIMFQAAYRSSSGALNCICSLWFIYACGDRPLSGLDKGRSPHVYINQRLQIQFRAPDDERCATRNMLSLR